MVFSLYVNERNTLVRGPLSQTSAALKCLWAARWMLGRLQERCGVRSVIRRRDLPVEELRVKTLLPCRAQFMLWSLATDLLQETPTTWPESLISKAANVMRAVWCLLMTTYFIETEVSAKKKRDHRVRQVVKTWKYDKVVFSNWE